MTRVNRGSLAAVAFFGLLSGSCSRDRAFPTFPDAPVILISIDTLRADRLPLYGYTKIQTPFLDRFAKDAWLFENTYSPCPMTLPAHTTMLTGMLPPEHGVRNNIGFVFDGQAHASLPRLLKQRGYATGAAVSSYVMRFETGLGALFDFYEDSFVTTPGVQSVNYQRSGDKTAVFAQAWIGEHAAKPFFFLFHIYEPHLPYDPPEPFRSRYGATYDGEVATSDAIVGGFLKTLKKLGGYDRAIVIVTSDHGEGLGEHGEQQHSIFLYREAIRVPLLVKLPANSGAGTRVAAPVQLSDIFPTVTAALGLPTPKEVSGTSLFAAGATAAAGRVIYGETLFPRLQLGWSDLRSILDSRYHYIHGPRPELYDMVVDPREQHDLAKSDPATVSRLARELSRFPKGSAKPASVDEETRRRLSSLGYLGTLRDGGGTADLPNPADNLPALRRMEEAWHLEMQGRFPRRSKCCARACGRTWRCSMPGSSSASFWRNPISTRKLRPRTVRLSIVRLCSSPISLALGSVSSGDGVSTRPSASQGPRWPRFPQRLAPSSRASRWRAVTLLPPRERRGPRRRRAILSPPRSWSWPRSSCAQGSLPKRFRSSGRLRRPPGRSGSGRSITSSSSRRCSGPHG